MTKMNGIVLEKLELDQPLEALHLELELDLVLVEFEAIKTPRDC